MLVQADEAVVGQAAESDCPLEPPCTFATTTTHDRPAELPMPRAKRDNCGRSLKQVAAARLSVVRRSNTGRVQFMSRDGHAALSGLARRRRERQPLHQVEDLAGQPSASPATRETSWAAGVRMTFALRCRTAPMTWRAARAGLRRE